MENMQYAEELVREFLVFRGFTSTLQVFETELSTDIGKAFQVDKIMDLIFSVYVPKFQAEKLVGLMRFLRQCLTSASDSVLIDTLSKLVISILRYYIVHALQSGRQDKVVEFFEQNGNDLMQRAVPYLNNPSLDPQFRVYFSREWFDMLLLSVRNFLSEIFSGIQIDGLIFATGVFVHASSKETVQTLPASVFNMFLEKIALGIDPQSCHALGPRIPALLKLSTEKNTIKHLNKDIKQLTNQVSQLQALLEAKEAQLCQLRSLAPSGIGASILQRNSCMQDPSTGNPPKDVFEENNLPSRDFHGSTAVSASHQGVTELGLQVWDIPGPARDSPGSSLSESEHNSGSLGDSRASDTTSIFRKGLDSESSMDVQREEEFPEVNVEFQETFLGHTSPISRCRFSAAGTNIASASVDGTVRIWTYDSSTSTARNATLYCGAEIMSLDWECKSGRLLLIGTADGGIKAWNADAKRVVCDLTTTPAFPSVLDLKCSPVEPIFVSAAASRGHGSSNIYEMGYASLTVWNMKTWKAMTALPLGKDPPAITSICFNHNGKILAASATDGMIHMFDISAGLQITGWPAHDTAVSSVQFGPDETSIFSLGSDGKIFEWSLQNQGQVLWSRDCSRFCHSESMKIPRHEMALDSNGRSLLVTSNSVRSPIYQVQSNTSGLRTLPHSGAITTVDWHPTMPIFLTGSVDHSVRVTSIS